jgi:hypothetical protein
MIQRATHISQRADPNYGRITRQAPLYPLPRVVSIFVLLVLQFVAHS